MPTFEISSNRLSSIEQTNFSTEKELQSLIESNLDVVFNCRFVATEFSKGAQHAGRIDTLALSEDNRLIERWGDERRTRGNDISLSLY